MSNKKQLKPIKVDSFKQGTPEWHVFRGLGLGSSDAGVISGLMPEAWDGFYSLKLQRMGGVKKYFSPEKEIVIQRGQDMEEEARQAYMEISKIKVEPACFIHPEREWQRASLDGIDKDWETIVEIKCSGEKVYNKVAHDLKIPNYYIAQMMHQLATVPTAKRVHFWMYDDVRGGVLMELLPDPDFIKELTEREEWFWNAMKENRRIYSGMLGTPIKIKHDYKMLYNAEQEKGIKTESEPESEPTQQELYAAEAMTEV
jgi:putative phage-type endonuclease